MTSAVTACMAPSHSGTQVPYEKILGDAWSTVRGANDALRSPAGIRDNLYPALERTFTCAEGIFRAHSNMASRELLCGEIARQARATEGMDMAAKKRAAAESVERCVSAGRKRNRPWRRVFPGMVLNMLLNEAGMDSACRDDDGACTVPSDEGVHTILFGPTWRKAWADAEDGTHIVTLYHDGRVSEEVLHRCRSGRTAPVRAGLRHGTRCLREAHLGPAPKPEILAMQVCRAPRSACRGWRLRGYW